MSPSISEVHAAGIVACMLSRRIGGQRVGRACGEAMVFYPETMTISNKETDFGTLQAAYERGYAQAQREADVWEVWLRPAR